MRFFADTVFQLLSSRFALLPANLLAGCLVGGAV